VGELLVPEPLSSDSGPKQTKISGYAPGCCVDDVCDL